MSIYTDIESDLSAYTVRQQGDFLETEKFPKTFITYVIVNSSETSHFSNIGKTQEYLIQFALYSSDKAIMQQAETILDGLLKPKGYLKVSGRDLGKDKVTKHYGLSVDYRKYYQI